MNAKKIFRSLILGICFIAYSFSANANDTLTFKWHSDTSRSIMISVRATAGENFTVTWGNGNSNTYQGNGVNASITANHLYAAGTYTVTISASTNSCFLTYFSCYNNQLTELDVSKCPNLQMLFCNRNQISNLDISKCGYLTNLDCSFNNLSSLDLSETTFLNELYCSSNQIDSLDVRTHLQMFKLDCSSNRIGSLNLTRQANLKELDCSSNQISSLNLNYNTSLESLKCSSNKLSRLNVSNMPLTLLYCDSNHLPLSDLYAASQKITIQNRKQLGFQTLPPQIVCIGKAQFMEQSAFNDRYTDYTVTKGGAPALENDYTVNNGMITFNALGNYTITMTNDAIVSNTSYPAKAVMNITIREANTDATLSDLIALEETLTPTFNSSIFEYTINVAENVSSIILTAIPNDTNAKISGDTGTYMLQTGKNVLTVVVTAEDDKTNCNYVVTVNRGEVNTLNYELQTRNYVIYPNPTTGQLTIDNGELTIESAEIFDIYGRRLYTLNSNNYTLIDISHLANGMYFLKIDNKTFKIIKQ